MPFVCQFVSTGTMLAVSPATYTVLHYPGIFLAWWYILRFHSSTNPGQDHRLSTHHVWSLTAARGKAGAGAVAPDGKQDRSILLEIVTRTLLSMVPPLASFLLH
jgi:hypothetical protein